MAKSMLDSRIIDLSFNKIFLKLVLGEQVALTLDNLKVPSIFRDSIILPHYALACRSRSCVVTRETTGFVQKNVWWKGPWDFFCARTHFLKPVSAPKQG